MSPRPEEPELLTTSADRIESAGSSRRPAMHYALWVLQVLLTALFLFTGVMKLVLPIEAMTKDMRSFPGPLLRLVGVAETVGAIGLILPGLLRIRPGLTPLAAAGLIVIMIGAVVLTIYTAGFKVALIPATVGLLLLFVAYARWRLVPHRGRSLKRS
jgi:uncharacterized membrane protein YphA (DoxX/SURF4 family)